MPGVSFDDQYPIHRKVAGLSDAAFRLHTSAVFWSYRNCTDGFIPAEDLALVCQQVRFPERVAAECVRRQVWHEASQECPSPGCPGPVAGEGWVLHDYLAYHPGTLLNALPAAWQGAYPLNGDLAPDRGVSVAYVLFDAAGECCYAGSTKFFPDRLTQHARGGKAFAGWVAYPCRDREAAYALERVLLAERQPYLNKKRGC
jgi:hypothetical protein